MRTSEALHIFLAVIVLFIVIGFRDFITLNAAGIFLSLIFAAAIIVVNVLAKKFTAHLLDSDVEHKIWNWSRYGLKPDSHTKKPVPVGVILPLFITAFSLGAIKFMSVLTYDTKALKRRAAKKFGYYSFAEMTDWHNSIIGGAGIIAILLLSFITYWIPNLETLARMAAFYAFFNMIPFSKLDGTQIYMGSRVMYYILAIFTLLFTAYALLLI